MKIYKVTNKIDGKIYIGQSVQELKKRWAIHCAPKSQCPYLHNAIKKHGKQNFSVDEIASYTNMEDLNNAEEYYIGFYNCLAPNGYNIQAGGNGSGNMHEETKAKISAATKGKKKSPEMRSKLSASKMGAKHNMFGKPARNRLSVQCVETGIIYTSQRQAAKALNYSESGITRAINIGYAVKGFHFIRISNAG